MKPSLICCTDDYWRLTFFIYKVHRHKQRYSNRFSLPSLPLGWRQTGLEGKTCFGLKQASNE